MSDVPRKVLVACLGNPDRGDDGIGAAVARVLAGRLPDGVGLAVRSGDMLALIDDWAGFDAVVCVDAAAPMDAPLGAPGRIHRVDLARDDLPPSAPVSSSHAFGLMDAVRLAGTLSNAPPTLIVYAVEGVCFDGGAPMTAAVAAAAEDVARRVVDEVRRLTHAAGLPVP
jgi:hydrogenase maturation protease